MSVFKTSIIYFLIRAINGVLGLATVFILTRLLSPEQYGAYALGLATIGLCASVLYQWIAVTISRFYALHVANPNVLIIEGNKLFFRVSFCALTLASIYLFSVTTDKAKLGQSAAILIGIVAAGMHNVGLQIANASGKPIRYGLLTVTRAAFTLCAAVGLVQMGYGSTGAVLGVAIGGTASVAIFRIRHPKRQAIENKELRKQMVVYGLPLTLTYLATMILDVSDRFMIGWQLGTEEVAGYAAAYDLTQQVIGAIMNVLFLASYPRITAAWEAGGSISARQAMMPLSKAILMGIPLLGGLFIGGADKISNFAFGEAISKDATQVIPWIAFAIIVGCFKSYYLDIAFQLSKATRVQLYITIAMALSNVVFNIILMPIFGVSGAAVSTAVAFMLGAYLSWIFGRQVGVYSSHATEAPKLFLVFSLVVLGMRLFPMDNTYALLAVVINTLFGCLIYVVAMLATNLANSRSIFFGAIEKLKRKFKSNATRR